MRTGGTLCVRILGSLFLSNPKWSLQVLSSGRSQCKLCSSTTDFRPQSHHLAETMKVVLPLLLLLMGLTAWWFMSSSDDRSDFDLPTEQVSEPGGEEAASSPIAADGPVDASLGREKVEASTINAKVLTETSDFTGPVLRIIDGRDQSPVGGVVVHFLDRRGFTEIDPVDRKALRQDPMVMIEKLGLALRVDTEGQVRLPEWEGSASVVCDDGVRSGLQQLRSGVSDPVLKLWPNASLTVVVKNHKGDPVAGVPVVLALKRSSRWNTWWTGTTAGVGGQVIVENPMIGALTVGGALENIEACVAAIALPLAERPTLEFEVTDLPSSPLELILPPTGSIEVVLDHPDISALAGAEVELERVGFDRGTTPGRGDLQCVAKDGSALFEHVGLGFDLRVRATLQGSDEPISQVFKEARFPGQRTVLRLSVASKEPVILIRILAPDGEPIRETTLNAKMAASVGGSSSTTTFNVVTSSDGWVRIALKDDLGDAAKRELTLYEDGDDARSGAVDIPQVLRIGDNDLGSLTLRSPPLVCDGVIVDPEGEPIAGAEIVLLEKIRPSPEFSYWSRADMPMQKTGIDGKFRLRGGSGSESEMALRVSCQGFLRIEESLFAVGSSNLRIVMKRAGAVVGSLASMAEIPDNMIEARLRLEGGKDWHSERVKGDVSFEFESLKPGRYEFLITVFGLERDVFEISGLDVRSGETLRDPRLQKIELKSGLRRLRFMVVNNSGASIADTVAMVVPSRSGGERAGGVFVDDGRGEVLAASEPMSIWVYAPGHRSLRVPDLRDNQEIVLDPALQVSFQVPAEIMAAAAPRHFFARLKPTAKPALGKTESVTLRGKNRTSVFQGSQPWESSSRGRVDASGRLVVPVMEPGEYELTWSLGDRDDSHASLLTSAKPRKVFVREIAGEQACDAQITVEQIERQKQGNKTVETPVMRK